MKIVTRKTPRLGDVLVLERSDAWIATRFGLEETALVRHETRDDPPAPTPWMGRAYMNASAWLIGWAGVPPERQQEALVRLRDLLEEWRIKHELWEGVP